MKIVRTPLGFNLDASAVNEYEFPDTIRERLEDVVTQAKENNCTVDWSTLCILPEETRIPIMNMAGEQEHMTLTRHLHATVDGVEIVEEENSAPPV